MAVRARLQNGVGMMGEFPKLQHEHTPEGEEKISARTMDALNLFLQTLVRKINGLLSFGNGEHASQSGNLDGQWIRLTTPSAANTEFSVPHGLGRTPVDYWQGGGDKAYRLYDSNKGGWNETTVYLKCDVASAQVRFVLF